jgi:hypothetical protein
MKRFFLILLASFCCLLIQQSAFAQSAIVNAPSTDVVAAKKLYVEMDFITNYAWQRDDDSKFANFLPRAVVGVGHNVEVGANVSYTRMPGGGEPIEVQPNVKWQFYSNESIGVAASAGCIGFIAVTHRTGTKDFIQCYSLASKELGSTGIRFTGGAYHLIGANADEKTKTGAIVAYEQPLNSKVQFIVDWQSGENRFGYISPALNFNMPHNGALSAGYAIANRGRGRNNLFVYYGTQF